MFKKMVVTIQPALMRRLKKEPSLWPCEGLHAAFLLPHQLLQYFILSEAGEKVKKQELAGQMIHQSVQWSNGLDWTRLWFSKSKRVQFYIELGILETICVTATFHYDDGRSIFKAWYFLDGTLKNIEKIKTS
jgi:hypothetical protein